jgi:pilus assembly protein CpaE
MLEGPDMLRANALSPDPAAPLACTVSRDLSAFDLLIEDMETELGLRWGNLTTDEAAAFLLQPEAEGLQLLVLVIETGDPDELAALTGLIETAQARGIRILLIAAELSPLDLHRLRQTGIDDFLPYPLPEGALHEAIDHLLAPPQPAPPAPVAVQPSPLLPPEPAAQRPSPPLIDPATSRNGIILAVQGLSGGVGATTFAVNLAWELTLEKPTDDLRVCLIDLSLQFGAVATCLDLPRREAVLEFLSDISVADTTALNQALISYRDRLRVLTTPSELVPLDLIGSDDVTHLLDLAKAEHDFVIVDLPGAVTSWTDTVLNKAQACFALLELDLRSAQNGLRLIRALKAEDLPHDRLRFVLNRAPGRTAFSARSRIRRLAGSLDVRLHVELPDGGTAVVDAADNGQPLAEWAPRNPLRKVIQQLAATCIEEAAARRS